MNMEYRDRYYDYGYDDEVIVISLDEQGKGYVTEDELIDKIGEALTDVEVKEDPDKPGYYILYINGKPAGSISIPVDRYLESVVRNGDMVTFKLNGSDDININIDELDNDHIDLSSY